VLEATLTAGGIGAGFLVVGDVALQTLGVDLGDVQVAGGLLLLLLSIYDLLHPGLPLRQPAQHGGVVPLGTPLIVGPAVLTTLLGLTGPYGYVITLLSFAVNLVIVWGALRWAAVIERAIGEAGSRAVTSVLGLLLVAIGVGMIRRGIEIGLPRIRP